MQEVNYSEESKDFFWKVWEVVKLIPEGRVSNYGAIAKYLGAPRSSRMVGWAMNAAHDKPNVPAHRVVNRIGLLTGKSHFITETMMEERLKKEGINVIEDKVQEFKTVFWDPSEELL